MDINSVIIDEEDTMIEAMRILDKVSKKILFVAPEEKLKAALTDGDIRRWILKKGNLVARVKDIANYDPKYLFENDKYKAKEYMKTHHIEALPIVDASMRIKSIVFLNDEEIGLSRNLTIPVVIMAGGLGTRLYPYTKILPKPLIPLGEIPISEHIINRMHSYGCTEFFLVVNYKKNMIKAYFNDIEKDYKITYIEENEALGTGGGISLLKGKILTTFILSNCDIIIDEDYEKMYNFHRKENNLITIICSLKNIKIPFGVIEVDQNGKIENMREKPNISFITNTGMYFVEPKVINDTRENIAISFPEIIEKYKKDGEKIGVYPISEYAWMDIGQPENMEETKRRLEHEE